MAGTTDHARQDQYRTALEPGCDRRCSPRAKLFRTYAASDCFGRLFNHHGFNYSLVAARLAPQDEHWLHTDSVKVQ